MYNFIPFFCKLDFKEKFSTNEEKEMIEEAGKNYFRLRSSYGFRDSLQSASPRFAQSVWLHYTKEGFGPEKWQAIKKNGWILEDSVIVQKSVPNTYFSTIIYGGGYAGIQQHPSESCGITEGNHLFNFIPYLALQPCDPNLYQNSQNQDRNSHISIN